MWRRQTKDQFELPAPEDETASGLPPSEVGDPGFTPWEEWEGRWAHAEQERVARWLADKVGPRTRTKLEHQLERLSVAFQPQEGPAPTPPAPAPPAVAGGPQAEIDLTDDDIATAGGGWAGSSFLFEQAWAGPALDRIPAREADDSPREAEADELADDIARLEGQRREMVAALEADRLEVTAQRLQLMAELEEARAAAATERRELQAALAAERAEAEEQRRRLAVAFQADQLESDRVRRLQVETKARLDAEIADLEERRHRATEALEDAVARLQAVREHAAQEESTRIELWTAIDAEVAALERRRDELHAGGGQP